ncbi:Hypothetical_protein [Hexamita inflata]|uniref:Hypothetical_protein n=1 Tax=Hexamita inflata TaxID=28002 RepID=A0AA86UQL8_9EUKA|nr:Hypothetical protein HINF_LOCUS48512 [Hexamita inflata]
MKNIPQYAILNLQKQKKYKFQSQFHKKYEQLNLYSSSDFVLARELMKIDLVDEYYKQIEIKDLEDKAERNKYQIQKCHKLPHKMQNHTQQIDVIEIVKYQDQKFIPLWKSAVF